MGVEAAHAAGIFTIAVNTGPLPDSLLLDAGADILLSGMPSLCDEWEKVREAGRYVSSNRYRTND